MAAELHDEDEDASLMQMNSFLFHITTGYYLAKRRLQNIVYSWYRAMKMSHMNAPSRLTGMENVLPISCTYIDVRHRILQDIRSKLNINKLRQALKVVIPRIITTDTTSKSFDGAMLICSVLR